MILYNVSTTTDRWIWIVVYEYFSCDSSFFSPPVSASLGYFIRKILATVTAGLDQTNRSSNWMIICTYFTKIVFSFLSRRMFIKYI